MGMKTRVVDFVRFHGTAGMKQKLGRTTHRAGYLLRLADDKSPEVRVEALRRMRHAGKLIMAESAVEPPHLNASSINIWQYRGPDGFIPEIVGIGHADSATCRRVSLLFYGAYLGSSTIPEESSLGVGFIRISDKRGDGGGEDEIIEKIRRSGIPEAFTRFFLEEVASFPMRSQGRLAATLSEIGRYESEIGLVAVHSGQLQARREVLNRIEEEVKKTQGLGRPKILRYQEEGTDEIMIVPFYLFSPAGTCTLVFKGGEKLFVDHPSFEKLSKIHRQRLLAEMREDAERRRMIYQLWKNEDEGTQQSLAKELARMSEAEKNEKTITVGGVRDYEKARTVASLEPHRIAPLEYATVHLPQMLQSDGVWIKRMEAILEDAKKEEKPGGKIDQINRAILIDAFLRGAMPTFAESEEERMLFETWKGARSGYVWETLSRTSGIKDLRRVLSQENVFFKVELQEGKLAVTPYAVVNKGDFAAVVDPKKRVVQYLDWWSHRSYRAEELAEGEELWQLAEGCFQKGISYLSCGKADEASREWKRALLADPAGTSARIISYYWEKLTKDTTDRFEQLKEKARFELSLPEFEFDLDPPDIDIESIFKEAKKGEADDVALRSAMLMRALRKMKSASPIKRKNSFERLSVPEKVAFLVGRGDFWHEAFKSIRSFINLLDNLGDRKKKRKPDKEESVVDKFGETVKQFYQAEIPQISQDIEGVIEQFSTSSRTYSISMAMLNEMDSISRQMLKGRLLNIARVCLFEALTAYEHGERLNKTIEFEGRLEEPRKRSIRIYFEAFGYYKKALSFLYSDPGEKASRERLTFDKALRNVEPLLLKVIAYAQMVPDGEVQPRDEQERVFFMPRKRVIEGIEVDKERTIKEVAAKLGGAEVVVLGNKGSQ